jgi:hypothetical protein
MHGRKNIKFTVLNILPYDVSNKTVQQVFIPMKHVTKRQMEASSYVLSHDLQGICEKEILLSVVFSLLMFQSIYITQLSGAGDNT